MSWFGAIAAAALIGVILLDAFEAMILPRRVRHSYRLARVFYALTWRICKAMACLLPAGRWRNASFSVFGPLSLFALMIVWAVGLIVGFALLHLSLGTALKLPQTTDDDLVTYLYFSGTTFFTLGYGDLVPADAVGRALSVAEAGLGFGFLAAVIGYLPVLYQAFSRREIAISLLDARAGSPPSAGELFRRLADARSLPSVGPLMMEWERWAAELLESHLSYPVLRFYRSQHDNQSWVGALTTILDVSAFYLANIDGPESYQARVTFAMARHAAVDLILVTHTSSNQPETDRLPPADLARLRAMLSEAGVALLDASTAARTMTELRGLYEPFVNALASYLQLTLPHFVVAKRPVDNWQTSPGMQKSPGLSDLQASVAHDQHFD